MNANLLWAGQEYAYHPRPPKGVETPLGARRVKLIKVVKVRDPITDRRRTMAEIEFVDSPNSLTSHPIGAIRTVPGRKIVDFWDEYDDRAKIVLAERAERERKRQEELARMERERQEGRRRRDSIVSEVFTNLDERLGYSVKEVEVREFRGRITVTFDLEALLESLNITERITSNG